MAVKEWDVPDPLDMLLYPIRGAFFSAWRRLDCVLTTLFWDKASEGIKWACFAN